jgi:hypothetical protein
MRGDMLHGDHMKTVSHASIALLLDRDQVLGRPGSQTAYVGLTCHSSGHREVSLLETSSKRKSPKAVKLHYCAYRRGRRARRSWAIMILARIECEVIRSDYTV